MANEAVIAKAVRKKRNWGRRLRWMAVGYLVFVLLFWWGHVTDRLILMPPGGTFDTRDARREVVTLANGDLLELWSARSPGAKTVEPVAFVMFFVGNADCAEHWAAFNAAQWGDKPVELVGMNYPGFRGSTGPAYLSKIGPAALTAYDVVRARAGKRPIFLQANSVGTTAALCVLANREVAGATIQNPPPLRRLVLEHHGWWNLWLIAVPAAMTIPSELDSVANAGRSKAPAVFVLSERDEVVPVKYQRMVYGNYAEETRMIDLPNATHNTGMDQATWDEFGRQVEWLWKKAGLE